MNQPTTDKGENLKKKLGDIGDNSYGCGDTFFDKPSQKQIKEQNKNIYKKKKTDIPIESQSSNDFEKTKNRSLIRRHTSSSVESNPTSGFIPLPISSSPDSPDSPFS